MDHQRQSFSLLRLHTAVQQRDKAILRLTTETQLHSVGGPVRVVEDRRHQSALPALAEQGFARSESPTQGYELPKERRNMERRSSHEFSPVERGERVDGGRTNRKQSSENTSSSWWEEKRGQLSPAGKSAGRTSSSGSRRDGDRVGVSFPKSRGGKESKERWRRKGGLRRKRWVR